MKTEMIDAHQFKKMLRARLGEGQEQANAYFKHTLLKSIQIAGGDFTAVLPRQIASIGTEILGETQASMVIADCAGELARQVEQSST